VLVSLSFAVWFVAGDSYVLLLGFVLVLGVGYGGFVALSTIVLAERMGVVGLGSILGLFYTSQGLGGLIGPPTAGWVIDRTGSYRIAIVACGCLAALARLLLVGLPANPESALAPE
jgi:MFS family permease